MKRAILILSAIFLTFWTVASAQDNQKDPPSPEEMAATTADKLGQELGLEGWQIFFVDSTLQHNYRAMQDKFDEFNAAKVTNYSLYQEVQDKWNERTDSTFRTFMTDEQYAKYLKQGAGKQQKMRAKRREKALKAAQAIKKEK